MSGFKVTYNNQTKRLNECIQNFENLLSQLKKLFNIDLENSLLRLCYVDKEMEKIEISQDEDYQHVLKYHKDNRGDSVVIRLEINIILKESINIDDMLNKMKLSESYAMIDKKDFTPTIYTNNLGKIPESLEIPEYKSFNISIISKDVSDTSTKNLEKGIQNDLDKKETLEIGLNTINLDLKEVSTQMDNTTEVVCETEKANQIEESVQEENLENLENAWENIPKDKNDIISQNRFYNLNQDNQNLNNSFKEEFLISKIDQIISNRLNQMEDNFKKIIENQQNSHIISNKLEICENSSTYENKNLLPVKQNQIDIQSEIKQPIEPISQKFTSIDQNKSDLFHSNDFCSICKYQIMKNKYICIMCENFYLCSQCEDSHNQHPLMKVNIRNQTMTSIDELINYCVKLNKQKKQKNKPNFLQKKLNKIGKIFKKSPQVCLNSKDTYFAIEPSMKIKHPIQVHNISKKKIEDITITSVNNKRFTVLSKVVGQIDANQMKIIEIDLESPNEFGRYEFEIIATSKDVDLISDPIRFCISVTPSDQVLEANANLLFQNYDEKILALPSNKKILLYNMINQKVIDKNVGDIIEIIKKYDYDVNQAIDELLTENERGECYYGIDY